MIADARNTRRSNSESGPDLVQRLHELDRDYFERRKENEGARSTYTAGTSDRMNPVPKGVNPLGTDADYHYRTERNYFLMVERGRAAVRNHPLVENGINRLIANLRLGDLTLDVNSGDKGFDSAVKDKWRGWSNDPKQCDFEQLRTFGQTARQSFFSQVTDGDISHLPLVDGSLQSWESHHLRNPWGHYPTGFSTDGIVHGVEVTGGRVTAYWITPKSLLFNQAVQRGEAQRFPAYDADGNKLVFWLGFIHRFRMRRGVSRLSPPRDAMAGFDDLNYANIKSSLRRALISYLMQQAQGTTLPVPAVLGGGKLPKSGDRYTERTRGLGLESAIVEQLGEPAQVFKAPDGYTLEGWNANLPAPAFFEHAALMLTMLAVNLDIPLSFLLLDGSLTNFHGGRMTFDQVKLRADQLISDQIQGLYNPTFEWKVRQWCSPGSPFFDPAMAVAVKKGANPFRYLFRPKGWPYVKPLEDAAAEDLAERRNLKSLRSILGARGVDEDEHIAEVISGRAKFAMAAIEAAKTLAEKFPDVIQRDELPRLWRELRYGNEVSGVQLAITADTGEGGETKATASAPGGKKQGTVA